MYEVSEHIHYLVVCGDVYLGPLFQYLKSDILLLTSFCTISFSVYFSVYPYIHTLSVQVKGGTGSYYAHLHNILYNSNYLAQAFIYLKEVQFSTTELSGPMGEYRSGSKGPKPRLPRGKHLPVSLMTHMWLYLGFYI